MGSGYKIDIIRLNALKHDVSYNPDLILILFASG